MRVITLPAYSPELNPIEGLLDQVFDTVGDLDVVLQAVLQRFWQDERDWIAADPDEQRVLVFSVPTPNFWFGSPVKLMRWRQLAAIGPK